MDRTRTRLLASLLTPLLALLPAFCLLLTGCGTSGSPEEDPLDAEFRDLQRQMDRVVDRLIAESMDGTREEPFAYEDGRTAMRRVPIPDIIHIPAQHWAPIGTEPIETPGQVLTSSPLNRRPWSLLVDDTGTCVVSGPEGVTVHGDDSTRTLVDQPGPYALQWNADGSLLLVDSPDAKRLILWPGADSEIDLLAEGFRGRLHFAPAGEAIWQVSDVIDPDPSSEVRVLVTSVRGRIPGGTQDVDIVTGPRALAGIGTLPQIGEVWGHRIRSGMILPRPAPLWLLAEDLRPARVVTDPGEGVDFAPATSHEGTVVFLRTRRIIDADDGLHLATNTRAWMVDLHSDIPERPLTGEPTFAAAISPDGMHMAFIVEREGMMHLIRTEPHALAGMSFDSSNTAIRAFEAQVGKVLDKLREAWASQPWHAILEAETIAYERPLDGAEEVLPLMAEALRQALADEHGLTLPDSRSAIALLDASLMAADGLIPEENATVLAVGGLYGELLAREPGVRWDYGAILPAFSNDLVATTDAEDDLFRVHSPFFAAREAISGRLRLTQAASEALGESRRAVGLVENFGARARAGFALAELTRVGIPAAGDVTTDAWRRIAERETDNLIANEAAWSAATARGEAGIAFAAAMNMAASNPANPAALVRFARELHLAGMDEAAIRLFDHAAVLAPQDPEIRLAVATAYFDLYRLDEAEALLRQIAVDFPAEAEIVADHLEVLNALREDDPESE